jgi:hypothetical protein
MAAGEPGRSYTCPHCRGRVLMTGQELIPAPARPLPARLPEPPPPPFVPQPQQQPVPIIIHTAPATQPRLEADGWFARGFLTTAGVLLAGVLILFVLPLFVMLMFCGGIAAIGTAIQEPPAVATDQTGTAETAKAQAVKRLAQDGFTVEPRGLDADVIDGNWYVWGVARDESGELRKVSVTFSVRQEANREVWRVVEVTGD